jgi:hypothetical protein
VITSRSRRGSGGRSSHRLGRVLRSRTHPLPDPCAWPAACPTCALSWLNQSRLLVSSMAASFPVRGSISVRCVVSRVACLRSRSRHAASRRQGGGRRSQPGVWSVGESQISQWSCLDMPRLASNGSRRGVGCLLSSSRPRFGRRSRPSCVVEATAIPAHTCVMSVENPPVLRDVWPVNATSSDHVRSSSGLSRLFVLCREIVLRHGVCLADAH